MTEFIGIEYSEFGKLVIRLRDEYADSFLIGERDIKIRIFNLKKQGLDATVEREAMLKLLEVKEKETKK
ncbi:MAG: hypothetical protein KAX49_17675 [Halanaerobiales bacterium]|nr:hypothetical protein [Halanaerobiales bacterium]